MEHSEEPSEDSNAETIPLTECAGCNLAAADYLTRKDRNIYKDVTCSSTNIGVTKPGHHPSLSQHQQATWIF